MLSFSKIRDLHAFISDEKERGKSIGFVPTMGALHQGHLELMRRAKAENDLLVVSIFVNPIQFNDPKDLEKYPRDLEKDEKLLESVACDILFIPDVAEMYPEKVTDHYDFGALENVMEGEKRPGHFDGVAIVVKKLFDIVTPTRAYFGEKDFQQLAIINKLVEIENIPVEIIACPIVREMDGLAMSSRNTRLSPKERSIAPLIYSHLLFAKEQADTVDPVHLKRLIVDRFKENTNFRLEYFEIAEDKNLQTVTSWEGHDGIMGFVVAHLGNVRLIDNIRFI